ncbi:50S ribosomal protein L18, partial [Striga asiatica]
MVSPLTGLLDNWAHHLGWANQRKKLLTIDTPLVWVHELLEPGRNRWNEELVRSCFSHDESKAILAINTLNSTFKDKWILEGNSNGSISVAKAYSIVYEEIAII